MFGCLFEKEDDLVQGSSSKTCDSSPKSEVTLCRGRTGLCGLRNQGATCYLNSLLQTFFFTPEFRGKFVTHTLLSIPKLGRWIMKDYEDGSRITTYCSAATALLAFNFSSI